LSCHVNSETTREGATAGQKARLINWATRLLVDELGKNQPDKLGRGDSVPGLGRKVI